MPEVPTRKHTRYTHKHRQTQTHAGNSRCFECRVTRLCSPCSLLRHCDKWGRYTLLSDRRFTLQEPIVVWRGEGRVGPALSPSFLQSKHPHAGSSNPPSPWGLYSVFPLLQYLSGSQYLQQCTSIQGLQLCLVYVLSSTCWCVFFHGTLTLKKFDWHFKLWHVFQKSPSTFLSFYNGSASLCWCKCMRPMSVPFCKTRIRRYTGISFINEYIHFPLRCQADTSKRAHTAERVQSVLFLKIWHMCKCFSFLLSLPISAPLCLPAIEGLSD